MYVCYHYVVNKDEYIICIRPTSFIIKLITAIPRTMHRMQWCRPLSITWHSVAPSSGLSRGRLYMYSR